MNNINIREEQQASHAKDPMYERHQQLLKKSGDDDLHMALKASSEIGKALSLFQFMLEINKLNPK